MSSFTNAGKRSFRPSALVDNEIFAFDIAESTQLLSQAALLDDLGRHRLLTCRSLPPRGAPASTRTWAQQRPRSG